MTRTPIEEQLRMYADSIDESPNAFGSTHELDNEQSRWSGLYWSPKVWMLAAAASLVLVAGLISIGTRDQVAVETGDLAGQPIPTPATPVPATPVPAIAGQPDVDAALNVQPALLGTYVVARPDAGIPRSASPLGAGQPVLEIPVYDTPFGPPRVVAYQNEVDGITLPLTLANTSSNGGALVLRVLAGGPDDQWIQVQSPSRPHDRFVWVRSNDFDFGYTDARIEIDLAGRGQLQVIDGDEAVLESEIVQGRDSRPTPVHVTYLQGGVAGASLSPAYGLAILPMASFSDVLGTFGGGGLPSNFLHGTNQAELMGHRVSSGEIRVPNDVLERVIALTGPGTPVLMFDSSTARPGRDEILAREPQLATTIRFLDATAGVGNSTADVQPRLWQRCPDDQAMLLCRAGLESNDTVFVTALEGAGAFDEELNSFVVPVYDEPGGPPRTLVYRNDIDGVNLQYPLVNPSWTGAPLVLRVIQGTVGDEWLRVQAPVRPQRAAVWVRAADFEFGTSTKRLEIDIAGEGSLTLYDENDVVLMSQIVSGRESRPTPLTESYIDQVLEGAPLTPAYGPYVASWPTFSEALGTFNGGALPKQGVHGTNQPGLMGQQVSSGKIRIPNEVMTEMVEQHGSLIGARVLVYDGSGISREAAIARLEGAPWSAATTTEPSDSLGVGRPQF